MNRNLHSAPDPIKKAIFVIGPTAVGKSQTCVYLAKKINAEIISCDSMQIYKGMDIASAKLTLAARKSIKHHLISIIPPTKSFNASSYRKLALRAMKDISSRKKIPLFAGGCGLYMSVILDGVFNEQAKDKTIREKLYKQAQKRGKQCLYNRLKAVDPDAALKIHPNDLRRVVRALEVYEKCGIPISVMQKNRKGIAQDHLVRVFGLNMRRDKLYSRIDQRVESMFKEGLLREARRLLGKRLSATARAAIGLKEIKEYLKGNCSLDKTKSDIQHNSRLYAKRQLTWFKKDNRVQWLNIKETEKPKLIAERIYKLL